MNNNHDQFIENILDILMPMHGITTILNNHSLVLCKDNVVFGKIEQSKFFLMNHIGRFNKVESRLLTKALKKNPSNNDLDKILFRATQAYWLACNQIKPIPNLKSVLRKQF